LYADLGDASSISINQLREAKKLQERRELDLVAGTQYFQILKNYFGVNSELGSADNLEVVALSQSEVNIGQVLQTSATFYDPSKKTTDLGNVAGYGIGADEHAEVHYTSQEYAVLIPLLVFNQTHTYQQGLHKFFNRKYKDDFFNPLQIGLGFSAIRTSEIYGHLEDKDANNIFGYAPSNERYRKETNLVTGMLNANFSFNKEGSKPQYAGLSK